MLLWHNMSLYLPRQAQDTLGYPDKLRTPMQYEHTENRKMIINNISGSQFNCAHETANREEERGGLLYRGARHRQEKSQR